MTIESFETSISFLLKKEYRLKIEPVSFPNRNIPKYILLDKTRNIHSYLLFCRNKNNVLESAHWNTDKITSRLIHIIQTQYSELDRPLFLIIQDEDLSLKVIEGNMIRERLLNNGCTGLVNFLLKESDSLNHVLMKISKEL